MRTGLSYDEREKALLLPPYPLIRGLPDPCFILCKNNKPPDYGLAGSLVHLYPYSLPYPSISASVPLLGPPRSQQQEAVKAGFRMSINTLDPTPCLMPY